MLKPASCELFFNWVLYSSVPTFITIGRKSRSSGDKFHVMTGILVIQVNKITAMYNGNKLLSRGLLVFLFAAIVTEVSLYGQLVATMKGQL